MSVSINVNRERFKSATRVLVAVLLVSLVASGAVAAQDDASEEREELKDQFSRIADLIILVIAAVAVPNGAYGLFEWMTAGANQEKNEKGKKRIRNTFIGLAGAAVIKVAVNLFTAVLGV